ncbi:MAG: PIG-L family deacetylase [candidate division KSB1 bacterium]|nr:PIG-L family deacetylase [candidate division KSB1 bacterium]
MLRYFDWHTRSAQIAFKILFGFFLILTNSSASAQPSFRFPIDTLHHDRADQLGNRGLHQALLDASTGFTLISVAAHPDDEDIFSITYYRRKFGVRTVVVVSNRGEGGQNEIGPELYTELAVVRSHEMAAAERISGGEYYNLNFVDFGYSKHVQETWDRWGREELERRLVRMIRTLRPEVIITNHDETSGHSNHQAVGRAIRSAFRLAADPDAFPEQVREGLLPWQPLRLFQRLRRNRDSADVTYEVHKFDPFLGMTYLELAKKAMAQHRSQGFDKFARTILPQSRKIRYKLVAAVKGAGIGADAASLFDGLSDPLADVFTSVGEAGKALQSIRRDFITWAWDVPADRERIARRALHAGQLCDELLSGKREWHPEIRRHLQRFRQQSQRIAQLALGLDIAVHHLDRRVAPGDTLRSEIFVANHGNSDVALVEIALDVPGALDPQARIRLGAQHLREKQTHQLKAGETVRIPLQCVIPEKVQFTEPETSYVYQAHRREPNCFASATVQWQGHKLVFRLPAPVAVAPVIQLEPSLARRIVPRARKSPVELPVVVRNSRNGAIEGQVQLLDETGRTVQQQPFYLQRQETFQVVRFQLTGPFEQERRWRLRAVAADGGKVLAEEPVWLRAIDVAVPMGVRVGVVQSYDPTLMQALQQLGIAAERLDRERLLWGDLDRYDVILIDIRAYLVRRDLRAVNDRLLDWVRRGGRLVVMYHKVFEWNAEYGNPAFAPYPLVLGRQRVTDETADVTALLPEHPLLNVPNKIGPTDWDGWVQERGLYFPAQAAPEFQRLLSMHDPGEKPLDTSLLYARYGRGEYIYTSLVWYRQLRALVPGAFRILANLVARSRH